MCWNVIHRKIAKRQKEGKRSVVRKGGKEVSEQTVKKERRHGPTITDGLFDTGVFCGECQANTN